jgi:hypothetical protein
LGLLEMTLTLFLDGDMGLVGAERYVVVVMTVSEERDETDS